MCVLRVFVCARCILFFVYVFCLCWYRVSVCMVYVCMSEEKISGLYFQERRFVSGKVRLFKLQITLSRMEKRSQVVEILLFFNTHYSFFLLFIGILIGFMTMFFYYYKIYKKYYTPFPKFPGAPKETFELIFFSKSIS